MSGKQYSTSKNRTNSKSQKLSQSHYSPPSKVRDNRKSLNKSGKTHRSSNNSVTDSNSQSFRSRRSIFETYEDNVDQKLIEAKNKNRLSNIINESPLYEKDANSQGLYYVEIGPTLSISSLYNLSRRLIVLRLTGTKLSKPSIPYIESLRTLFLDQCKLESLVGFPLYPKLRYLNLSKNNLETFKGFPVYPDLEEFDIRDNKVDFSVDFTLAAIGSVSMNIYNGEKINERQIRKAFSRSPLVGYALRQGFPIFNNEEDEDENQSQDGATKKPTNKNVEERANEYLINGWFSNLTSEKIPKCLNVDTENATITLPIQGQNINWYINVQPSSTHPTEWEQVPKDVLSESDKKYGNKKRQILIITQIMYQHLIRCEFSIDSSNRRCSMYTQNVIGSGLKSNQNELILPFPLNPQVTGNPYEGSLVSLVPMPVPCFVSWYNEKELIAKDVNSIQLKEDYIGKEISCLLQPHCRSVPSITFTHLLTKTNPVEKLNPVVTNVYFPDDIIEGIEFKFSPIILPSREGDSEIFIERAFSPSGEWETITRLKPFQTAYTPTYDDVNCFLRCSYLPILNDGTKPIGNKPSYFYSKSRVIPGFPTFNDQMIAGDAKSGHPVVAIAKYFGGLKGECNYKWYKSTQAFKTDPEGKSGRPSVPFSKIKDCQLIENQNSAILYLSKPLVGLYLAVEMTPVRNDDTVGENVYAYLNAPVEKGEKLTPFRNLPQNDQIFSYRKIDAKINTTWYRTNSDWRDSDGRATGFEKVNVGQDYTPTGQDVGNFLRLVSKNGDSDVIIGEVKRNEPFIPNFKLKIEDNRTKVGSTASIPLKVIRLDSLFDNDDSGDLQKLKNENAYLNGVPKSAMNEYYDDFNKHRKVEVVWVRLTKNNPEGSEYTERVVDIDTLKYVFTKEDIGSKIKAVVYPLDDDGNRYPPTHSESTGVITAVKIDQPIMKGQLKVGCHLSIEFKDQPIYSITWERTKSTKWEPIQTYTFDHFENLDNGDDAPVYSYNVKDKPQYTAILDYVVGDADVDYHIQAEVVPGEIREVKEGSKTVKKIVPNELFRKPLKSNAALDKDESDKTGSKETKQFSFMERVAYKDLDIKIEPDPSQGMTEGQTFEVSSKVKKPRILWEAQIDEINKKTNDVVTKWKTIHKGNSYTFTSNDVYRHFRINCLSTGEIKDLGKVGPSVPTVSNFTIKQDSAGFIAIVNANYKGGVEGKSLYFYSLSNINNSVNSRNYSKEVVDNSTLNVKKFNRRVTVVYEDNCVIRKFQPTEDMLNKRIDIGILPVRSDSAQGKLQWSNNGIVVKSIPIVEAEFRYPNNRSDNLKVGSTITCAITQCSLKNCSFKYTWERYIQIANKSPNGEDKNKSEFEKQPIKSNTTINDTSTYNLAKIDNGSSIVCKISAIAENGYISQTFIINTDPINFAEMKDYTLSINVPRRQSFKSIKSTKRASESLSRSEKLNGEVDTGDRLTPVLTPELKKGLTIHYEWQTLTEEANNAIRKRRNSENEEEDENEKSDWITVSMDDSYTCSILDVGCMIKCACTIEGKNGNSYFDSLESIPIGPIRINPMVEAPAKAIIRSNSFKIRGKAPSGKGEWNLLASSKGLSITKINTTSSLSRSSSLNNEQTVKWSNVECNLMPDQDNQIEIITGPSMRFIIVPSLTDQRLDEIIPINEVRDFCVYIINQFKKKNAEKK